MMDLQRSYFFAVFTVMLIHEVEFSKCDLKTKTHIDLIKSYVDGFQRRERQAPIDPSRMYLPPKIDSVASGGFGDPNVDASNNFGGNTDAGYGEVGLVQDTQTTTDDGGSNYGVPSKTAGDGSQGGDSYGLASGSGGGRNNFGRQSNANNGYNNGQNFPNAGENYGGGGGSSSVPGNNNNYNVGTPNDGANGYGGGRDELLNTAAQSRGPTTKNDNNYNNNSDKSTTEAGAGVQNGGASDRQYGRVAAENDYGNAGARRGGNSYGGGGNFGSNEVRGYSGGGGGNGNTVPNSFSRKPLAAAAGGYSQDGNAGSNSYGPAATSSSEYPGSNFNKPPPTSTDFEKQGNGIQQNANNNNGGGDFGEPGPNAFSNFAPGNRPNPAPSADNPIDPPSEGTTQINGGSDGGNQGDRNEWSGSGNPQTAAGGHSLVEPPSAGYGPSNQSPPQGYDSYGQSGSRFETGNSQNNYYGQISPDSSGNAYDPGSLSTSSFNPDQQNQQPSNTYGGQSAHQTQKNGRHSGQGGYSSVPSANGAGYNGQTPSIGPSGLDQNQPATNNDYGTTESQLSSSNRNGYGQRSSTTYGGNNIEGPNGYSADSQSLPSTGENYNSQNLPTNNGNTQEGSQSPTSASRRNNFAQIDTPQDSLHTQSSGQGSSSPSSSIGRPCNSPGGENIGQNGLLSSTSTIPGTNSRNEIQNKKKYSTIVPKGQYQNSNLPSSTGFQKQGNGIQNANNNGHFGESALNAFSNFAPGNQPNTPINKNNNNCNANNQGNNGNTQYESVFSGSNTGYW